MRKTGILLALMLALALVLTAPLAAWAAGDVTIDLDNIDPGGEADQYDVAGNIITVTAAYAAASNTVTITGDGGAGYSIVIEAAQYIEIEDDTTIVGVSDVPALEVPAGATITGQGAGISISGTNGVGIYALSGNVTIAGIMGDISGNGGDAGIGLPGGSVMISGTVDAISGYSAGISVGGSVMISGEVGEISGIAPNSMGIVAHSDVEISGAAIVGEISGRDGIFATNGNVTISGAATVGNISGTGADNNGIFAGGNVNISGTVTGGISGTGTGISATGNVTISGTVTGEISGTGDTGIYATGNVTISGTVTGEISGTGDTGIYATGSVTISGTTGDISGTDRNGIEAGGAVTITNTATVGNISGNKHGIYAGGNVEISGQVGDISGNSADSRGISAGGNVEISGQVGNISGIAHGIQSGSGSVTISGTVGDISGGKWGIYASENVTISGTVGNISGTGINSRGISAIGYVEISGTVGNISGGEYGIFAGGGNVIITGKVNKISSEFNAIAAWSGYYTVLDYNGSLLDIATCDPAGFTVTFNYGTLSPSGVPKKAYISSGNKIPSFTVPATSSQTFVGWYKESALTNSWNFNSDAVTANITLYAKWSGNNSSSREDRDNDSGSLPKPTTPNTSGNTVTTPVVQPPVTDANPFTDVKTGDWFYDNVIFVYAQGLMNGTGDNMFSPNATLTRAMFITILARLSGVDTAGGETWYAKAVAWAVAEGITDGANLHDPITREQIAVMLQRYAQLPIPAEPTAFADDASISAYAREAVYAMQGAGVISGKTGNLFDPQGAATRAEAAAMLQRLAEALVGEV